MCTAFQSLALRASRLMPPQSWRYFEACQYTTLMTHAGRLARGTLSWQSWCRLRGMLWPASSAAEAALREHFSGEEGDRAVQQQVCSHLSCRLLCKLLKPVPSITLITEPGLPAECMPVCQSVRVPAACGTMAGSCQLCASR